MKNTPPTTLDSANVLAFAIVDESVTYLNRRTLYVDGMLLGVVPKLAICQNEGEMTLMVFHCDQDWNVLGVTAEHESISEAIQCTERSYNGLSEKWVKFENA